MDLAQERAESSQGTEVMYQLVDSLDDSFRAWTQQRLKGSLNPELVICSEREQVAPSKATRMDKDHSTTGQRATKVVRTYVAITTAVE